MGLMDRLLNALRGQAGRPLIQKNKTYGSPGRPLVDLNGDYEDAGADIARDMNASFPARSDAMVRAGFDPRRNYDAERAQASQDFSDELMRTWEAGKLYSPWVSDAARRAGI
jgi:hypothetical protein